MTLEKDIENQLTEIVKRHGGRCLKWVCPGWAGVPDRIILLPGGRVIFVETKRPKGGRLGPLQRWWRDELQRLGCEYYLINTREVLGTFEQLIGEGQR